MIWQQRQSQLPQFYNLDPHLSSIAQQKRQENAVDDTFDEVAFEKAFDTAKMEIMDTEPKGMDSPAELGQTISAYARTLEIQENNQSFQSGVGDRVSGDLNDLELDHFDFDAFLQGSTNLDDFDFDSFLQDSTTLGQTSGETTSQKSDRHGEADADELAKTAGQLLDSLKHEQSQKFQQSNFLALMRQLRDKEVRVEGDKMVDVNVDVSIFSFADGEEPSCCLCGTSSPARLCNVTFRVANGATDSTSSSSRWPVLS